MSRHSTPSRAFTLIELLVAMTVIIVLASIALLVVPDILNRDRTTDGAGLVRQWLMIAKARAMRDGNPNGVRFLTGLDPDNPLKSSPLWVTECQYVEQPPPYTPKNPLYSQTDINAPQVKFVASFDGMGNVISGSRQCWIDNLTPASGDANTIVAAVNDGGCWLSIPVLPGAGDARGFYARITNPNKGVGSSPGTDRVTVTLDIWPDAALGSAGTANTNNLPVYVAYGFALIFPPRPLLGEPSLPLPKNICVDLNPNASLPAAGTGFYDIVFTKTGHIFPSGAGAMADGQICLWVRDYTKAPNAAVIINGGPPPTYDVNTFKRGGEQQLVGIKTRSGAMGQFKVLWPDMATGQYKQLGPGVWENPYWLAQQGATSP